MMTSVELVVVVLVLSLASHSTRAVTLEGSQKSFAQFERWKPGLNGSLAFEFSTNQPKGLLLYTDDRGRYDFFEVKLVDKSVVLHLNLGDGPVRMKAGKNLNDGRWHKVEIAREHQSTRLRVDDDYKSHKSPGEDITFGDGKETSDVWMGGLPIRYNTNLAALSEPGVIFEPKLQGAVRNLMYRDGQRRITQPAMVASEGVRKGSDDLCRESNPCQNDGVCISTDTRALCDCQQTEFDGEFCENEKKPAEATFRGFEYISYNLTSRGGGIISTKEDITLFFKTPQPSGLLFYSGGADDHLIVALRGGTVYMWVNLGSGVSEIQIPSDPPGIRFDDNRWHKVTVQRRIKELTWDVRVCRYA